MATIVIDTNILILATPSKGDFNSEAAELLWKILNICHCVAVDVEGKIVDREYKKYMRHNQTLTTWWTYMRLKDKIKTRSGKGAQICTLKEMDNCFACVAMKTPDRILVTENERDFNSDVKRRLGRRGVKILNLNEAYGVLCRNR